MPFRKFETQPLTSEYQCSFFREFMDKYFGGSPEQVLSYFVREEGVDPEQLDQLIEKIKKRENDAESKSKHAKCLRAHTQNSG